MAACAVPDPARDDRVGGSPCGLRRDDGGRRARFGAGTGGARPARRAGPRAWRRAGTRDRCRSGAFRRRRGDRGGAGVSQAVEPQRLLLVLPSTGEFDSRTYRIATWAIGRGHQVTVLARWKAGLPEREMHPSGYEIIRIPTDPGSVLPGRDLARRLVRRVTGSRNGAAGARPPVARS